MSFNEAKSSVYRYESAINEKYIKGKPILTIIFSCYYRLDLIKQSLNSILSQDYQNIELIIVDNAAQLDVKKYLIDFHKNSINASLITFETNQFEWSDVCKEVAVCWNVALLYAKGDYVCHISHDDLISQNYASCMVRLFMENPACVTAAPMPYSINALGEYDKPSVYANFNKRLRYTDGVEIAMDFIQGCPNKLFMAPGEIFVIRRDVLIQYGGFDRIVDISQVLKYAIFGVSGFDPDAALYWRHHDGQLNKQAKLNGDIFYKSSKKGWDDSGIDEIWRQRFDTEKVKLIIDFKHKWLVFNALNVLKELLRGKNFNSLIKAMANIATECPWLIPKGIYVVIAELFSMVSEQIFRNFKS
jgi:glycosyltransferase involved in cell wall biosynthesis